MMVFLMALQTLSSSRFSLHALISALHEPRYKIPLPEQWSRQARYEYEHLGINPYQQRPPSFQQFNAFILTRALRPRSRP